MKNKIADYHANLRKLRHHLIIHNNIYLLPFFEYKYKMNIYLLFLLDIVYMVNAFILARL